jgi:uncharacterized cupin superfamily protein
MRMSLRSIKVLIILSGAGQITAEGSETVRFKKGDTLLIPAAFEGVMKLEQECEYLTATIW